VSRIAGRRTPPPIVRDSATVVAGFALAAIVSSLQLLLGLLVLGAVGIVLGMRRNPRWGGIVIGSILGGVVLDAAAVLVQAGSTQPASERFVSALGSALLVGTVLGGALVLPGYLFGRAYRRSVETPGEGEPVPGTPGESAVRGPSVISYAGSGCAILLLDVTLVFLLIQGLRNIAP